jgi:hypothetical protein
MPHPYEEQEHSVVKTMRVMRKLSAAIRRDHDVTLDETKNGCNSRTASLERDLPESPRNHTAG